VGSPSPFLGTRRVSFFPLEEREGREREVSERERERGKKNLFQLFRRVRVFCTPTLFFAPRSFALSEKAKAKKAFPIKKSALAYHSLFSPPLVCLFSVEKQMSA
jgi:hypothetical protein